MLIIMAFFEVWREYSEKTEKSKKNLFLSYEMRNLIV